MKLKFIIFLIIFFYSQLFSQENNNVVAKVGEKNITAKEFKYRYELTPQINRKLKDEKRTKEEFLFTLIAEDLFAQQAEELGFDTLKDFRAAYVPLEKMYVRDALYKQEITNKIKVGKEQLIEGLKLANKKLFVNYVFSLSKSKIKEAYKILTNNNNFDSLATQLDKTVEYVNKPYEVTFGKMSIEAEKAVFNLKPNEITKPIKSEEGWYIFHLLREESVQYKSITEKESLVKKIVKNRIEDSIYNDYRQHFLKGKHITTNGTLFWYLAENLQKIILEIKEKNKIKEGEKIIVSPKGFIQLQKSLNADSLKKTFIQIPNSPITLEDFLNDFMFEGFFTFTTDLKVISAQLSSRVKRQIELELLAAEGYKKGLESLPEVKQETRIWKNNYLATLYRRDFINKEKLTDEDIKEYLTKNTKERLKETEVNIIEVTTNSLEEIEKILKQEENGMDLKELAKKYTNKEKVETGFFSVSENKEIGTIAETMNTGDIYGPIKTNNGYTVFKLIDKKESNLSAKISQLDEETKRKIRYKKVLENLENKTAELAEKYKVTIDEKLLDSIKLLNAQMVVLRYMGFGGRIPAFPNVTPFFNWKEKWEQKKKESL
jgi:parvulin-like peptidyl-prolyl isomerase